MVLPGEPVGEYVAASTFLGPLLLRGVGLSFGSFYRFEVEIL